MLIRPGTYVLLAKDVVLVGDQQSQPQEGEQPVFHGPVVAALEQSEEEQHRTRVLPPAPTVLVGEEVSPLHQTCEDLGVFPAYLGGGRVSLVAKPVHSC